jgi:uncharacterized protein
MPSPGPVFREIHRLRRHIKGLQDEIDRFPRLLKTQQAKAARQEELFKEAQDALKRLKVKINEKEVSLKSTHTQIAKHQKQLNEAAGKKEYDALQVEITAEKQKGLVLEEEILGGMAEIEEKAAALPEMEKAVKKAKQDCIDFAKTAKEKLTGLTEQRQQAAKDLKTVEADLPTDIKPQIDREVASKGEEAFAAIHNRNCTACHTAVTSQAINDLLQGMFVCCKSCGRINYLVD